MNIKVIKYKLISRKKALKYIKKYEFEHKKEDSFMYLILSRMQFDCENYINGFNHLYCSTVDEHITLMVNLYKSFKIGKKPKWLTLSKIDEYHQKMKKYDLYKAIKN